MGSSKSSRVVKTFLPSKKSKKKEAENAGAEETSPKNEEIFDSGEEIQTTDASTDDTGKPKHSKASKKSKQQGSSSQKVLFPDTSVSNLSRALGANDWIKLAYALGFLPQAIAHFAGRASSAQNSYSQCTLMLKTWRKTTPPEEILSRLCDGLRRIRRHDLAVKMGLELGTYAIPQNDENEPDIELKDSKYARKRTKQNEESKLIFTNKNVSFLARHLLAREEWKRLAYALGFYPDDASQIIASASSCQNLYAQAHLMLLKWRDQTPPSKICRELRAAFVRIRRHDLAFLLDIGVIAGPEEIQAGSLDKLCQVYEKVKISEKTTMGHSEIAKFKDLLMLN